MEIVHKTLYHLGTPFQCLFIGYPYFCLFMYHKISVSNQCRCQCPPAGDSCRLRVANGFSLKIIFLPPSVVSMAPQISP